MKAFNLVVFASLLGSVWCGVIIYDLDRFQGPDEANNQNSPIININNQQQTSQTETSQTVANQLLPNNLRGDYGSLPYGHSGHFAYGSNMDSNFKASVSSPHGHQGVNSDYILNAANYGSQHHLDSSLSKFNGGMEGDMSSHQIMKQENFKYGNGHNFGYGYNMFINAPNQIGSSGSYSSASSSTSSSTNGVVLATAATSGSASSLSVSDSSLRPWNHRF